MSKILEPRFQSHTLNISTINEQKLKPIAIIPRPPSSRTIIMSHHITCVCIVLSSHMSYNQNQLLIHVRSAALSLCSSELYSMKDFNCIAHWFWHNEPWLLYTHDLKESREFHLRNYTERQKEREGKRNWACMRVVNLSSAVISTPVPVETAEKHSCLTRLQSTLFNAVRISTVNSIIIGCLLADVTSAVYRY